MYYTIGEAAKRMNLSTSALRYYDKEGLLPFVERTSGGIRMFQDEDFDWLEIIECLKKTGMPIKEIKEFVDWSMEGDSTIDTRLELIKEQQEVVRLQIEAIQENLKILNYKRWYYETAKQAGTCDVHKTMKPEDIPEEFREIALHNKKKNIVTMERSGKGNERESL